MPATVVPEGTIFALGDHRDRSNDSRNPRLGMVPVERVRGRAIVIYWSEHADRIGRWIP
jgi:signal peptidase I